MYLNTVYFGRGAYGIQAAAQAYFGVDAKDLTVERKAQVWLLSLKHRPSMRRISARKAIETAETTS